MRSKKIIYLVLLLLILTGCKEKTYTVTFDTLGGSLVDSVVINKGETLSNLIPPTKEGYLFVNWLKDGLEYNLNTPITEDVILTAHWIEKPTIYETYTVTFVMETGVEKFTVKEGETIKELTPPEKENYTFLGWFVGEEKFDFTKPITKDIALTAKYEYNIVTVTYQLDGGYGLAYETVKRHDTISIPMTPFKPGYKFIKWTLNDKEFSFDTKIKEDITLKAVWQLIEYVTVFFDTDGGNILNGRKIEKYSKINDLPTPVKEGYIFKEWQLNGESFTSDTSVEDNITLIAIYETTTTSEEQPENKDTAEE